VRILVTAGNSQVPIDKVRTGTMIALEFCAFDHQVTLITSSPELIPANHNRLHVLPYRTFDEFAELMEREIRTGLYDAVVHSAAVSDYRPTGNVFVPCDAMKALGIALPEGFALVEGVPSGAKISSSHPTLLIETVKTIKIIDKIHEWGFKGFLVKFKLQVGITDGELIEIACNSREQSNADLVIANCLEWSGERAYVIGRDNIAHAVPHSEIAGVILRKMQ
jgi:phosphopantothenate-cysteine ligase/phosphopantothenoylcysteine decarboxylase/phosphopantothenate--cysteine ligase